MSNPVACVSVIVPMLDEAAHVEALVDDLRAQDYAGELEVIVADGGSRDGSPDILREAARRAGLAVIVIPNPGRYVSPGLNACIARAKGELIVRLDCHSRYPSDYLSRCAVASAETGADNVGGVVVPTGRTPTERAVACAMDSPFGGIGWTRHAQKAGRVDTDTVTFGAFRREALRRVGGFDETLVRNQDEELNLRLRLGGGRVVLDPTIRVHYVPRGTYRALARQYCGYGFWKVTVRRKHSQRLSARSLVPLAFLTSLVALSPLAAFHPAPRWLLVAELVTYAGGAAAFAVAATRRRGESLSLFPRVAAAFPAMHLPYAVGLARGSLAACRHAPRSIDGRGDTPESAP
ncbi:MAG: glycosyltransferase family 2 protein [Thermoleophilia bacterium]|nr:glycosyltransferase family 2 protein [Thermoleophilia bacterium]